MRGEWEKRSGSRPVRHGMIADIPWLTFPSSPVPSPSSPLSPSRSPVKPLNLHKGPKKPKPGRLGVKNGKTSPPWEPSLLHYMAWYGQLPDNGQECEECCN